MITDYYRHTGTIDHAVELSTSNLKAVCPCTAQIFQVRTAEHSASHRAAAAVGLVVLLGLLGLDSKSVQAAQAALESYRWPCDLSFTGNGERSARSVIKVVIPDCMRTVVYRGLQVKWHAPLKHNHL